MTYKYSYQTPEGFSNMIMNSDGEYLTGLWFENSRDTSKHDINCEEKDLPICIAKTQYSISDDPKKLGYPKDYEVTVRDIELHKGAGFITVFLGNILTMPGLPKKPNYESIDLDDKGNIIGLF